MAAGLKRNFSQYWCLACKSMSRSTSADRAQFSDENTDAADVGGDNAWCTVGRWVL